jgi:probable selenium-dependent hydroxylase accessory protein YqeC
VSLRAALLLDRSGVISLVGAGGKTSLMYRLARELSGAGEKVLTTTTTRIFAPTPEQSPACILSGFPDEILERADAMLKKHRHLTAAAGQSSEAGKLAGLSAEAIDRLQASRVFDWIIVEADGAASRPLKAPAAHEPVIPSVTGCLVGMIGLSAIGQPLDDQWVFRAKIFSFLSGLPPGAKVTEEAVAAVFTHARGVLKGAPPQCRRMAFLNQAETAGRRAAALRIAHLIGLCGAARIQRTIIGQILGESPACDIFEMQDY